MPVRLGGPFALALSLITGASALFAPAARATSCPGSQTQLAIIPDGSGGAILAWADRRSGELDIFAQRVSAAGVPQWAPGGVALCIAAGVQDMPAVVSDGAGGAIVAWRDYRGANRDIYAQRVDAAGMPLWTGNGVPVCSATGNQTDPTLVSDGLGGAIVAWADGRSAGVNLYAQRVNMAGTPLWGAGGVAANTAIGSCAEPRAVTDGAGGAILAWGEAGTGSIYDVLVQRIGPGGVTQWAPNGVVVRAGAGALLGISLVSDEAGGATVFWLDARNGAVNRDIYAQAVNASGVPRWTAGGVAVCTAVDDQLAPATVSDGQGGAIVTWYDKRSGPAHIYAARVNVAGATPWTPDGVPLCVLNSSKQAPAIAPDGAGGALVTWADGAPMDIRAQRVDSTGAPQWTTDGEVVCGALMVQQFPVLATDGDGGAIVAWEDSRVSPVNAFAQRMSAGGASLWAADGVSLCSVVAEVQPGEEATAAQLEAPVPNPARGATQIPFALSREGDVSLTVFDLSGREVRVLVRGRHEAGRFSAPWDLRDDAGNGVPSGVYFVRLRAAGRTLSRAVVTTK